MSLYRKEQIITYRCDCGKLGRMSINCYLKLSPDLQKLCANCKRRLTKTQVYGSPTFNNMNKMKQTKKDRYGDEYFTNQIKREQTCLKNFGTKSPLGNKIIVEKIRQTNLERFGVEHPAQSQVVLEKMKQTNRDRYGTDFFRSSETCKNRCKETRYRNYNGDYAPLDFGQKCKQTNLMRYGVPNYSNLEKRKQTSRIRYGVDHPMQNPEIAKKNRSKVFWNDSFWDSTWEVLFYEFHKVQGHKIERNDRIQFYYEFEGKKHGYQPDFILDDRFLEIKGDHFFDKNTGKMINPFDRSQDDLYEAKHQCMLKNNITIVTSKDFKEILTWLKACENQDLKDLIRKHNNFAIS